jgi:hypothetical protein
MSWKKLLQSNKVNSSPVTDEPVCLEHFAHAGVAENRMVQQIQSLRVQVLEEIFPVPNHPIDPRAIRTFRDHHREMLVGFRRRVERELIAALAIPDEFLRQRQLNIFFEEAAQSIEEIQASMSDARWRTVRGTLSVLAAIPGALWPLGLAGAVLDAFSGKQHYSPSQDFAYAAYASAELRLPGLTFGPAGRLLRRLPFS